MRLTLFWPALLALAVLCACGGTGGSVAPATSGKSVAPAGRPADSATAAFGVLKTPPPAPTPSTPGCTGFDGAVRASGKTHGMFVWNPNHFGPYVERTMPDVIKRDRALCGVSFVINWRDVNPAKGVYDWSYVDGSTPPPGVPPLAPGASPQPTNIASPYVEYGLRVNLLFADGPELGSDPDLTVNDVTPDYVTASVHSGGDGVPIVACSGLPNQPYYPNAKFEADWAAFITAAVQHFSNDSPIEANIGYMRFGQGFGTEDEPGHGYDGETGSSDWTTTQPACQNAWYSNALVPPLSVATWKTHSLHVLQAIAAAKEQAGSNKQMMIALNGIYQDTNDYIGKYFGYTSTNAVAQVAAEDGVGFGTENLGDTSPPTKPCTSYSSDLYWCAPVYAPWAYHVPIEFQTITSTTPSGSGSELNITTILQYAIDNNAQILELYPSEWLYATGHAPSGSGTAPTKAVEATYACALFKAGQTLGLAPEISTSDPSQCGGKPH
jgi:hypothetical protein